MAAAPVRNESIPNPSNNKKRRRKKRRTEDFSDSSSSSSSSSSDEESVGEESKLEPKEGVNIDDITIDSDNEADSAIIEHQTLSDQAHQRLAEVNLTTTQLSNISNFGTGLSKITNVSEIQETLEKDKLKLNAQFLSLMASEFSDDLDELRKKPDFNDKSLVLLAKALQSGSNVFDPDTLNAILS